MVARMPKLVLLGAAEPRKPPMHHLGPAPGHARQSGHEPLAVGKVLVPRFERQIARIKQIVCLTEFHVPSDISCRAVFAAADPFSDHASISKIALPCRATRPA